MTRTIITIIAIIAVIIVILEVINIWTNVFKTPKLKKKIIASNSVLETKTFILEIEQLNNKKVIYCKNKETKEMKYWKEVKWTIKKHIFYECSIS